MEKTNSHLSKSIPIATISAAILLALSIVTVGKSSKAEEHGGFNQRGNILIADQFNNRVIEVDKDHNIIWHFGDGSSVAGPTSIVGTNDAQRVGNLTLIAGTGTPPGADPSCPNVNGCADNRVILVNEEGEIVWQYGQAGVTGSGPNQLNTPVQNTYLPNHHILITDQANERVIEVTKDHNIVWQYGMTGIIGAGFNQLSNPNSAELLENGHILIADENNNRVIEVNRAHHILWQYGNPNDTTILNGAAFASRLPGGNTLVTDSNNNRIVEVTHGGNVVWEFHTDARPNSNSNPLPTRAVRLRNGDTLISDQFNDQVIEVNKKYEIVWSMGMINTDGIGDNLLNAPYDAKMIGDYTGLTPPPNCDGHEDEGGNGDCHGDGE